MMNIYCELSDVTAARLRLPKYVTICSPFGKFNIAYTADRIWKQDESGVFFIKHRHSDPETTPVDMTEFMLVKLKSVSV